KSQAKLSVVYKGINVGDFIADVFVEEKVILELKVTNSIVKEMQAQLMNYLKASGIKIGYLINFGNPKLEWKRIVL
ncbi:MAG TPA: GxxExxY protein, partial [Leptospiraceae bacterium]|nr:GxxExxY protein [Leptospiraceae bacterium]